MAERVMFVHQKTGYNTDQGPAWISLVRFTKTWHTAYWHGHTLERVRSFDGNFADTETGEEYWLSGPHRDEGDTRYSNVRPTVDDDVRDIYRTFLDTGRWPERLSRHVPQPGAASDR